MKFDERLQIEAQTLSVQRLARSDPHHTQPPSSHSLPSPRSAEARCFLTPPNTAQHYFTPHNTS